MIERMKQSCNIIEQCLDKLPPGEFRAAKLPKTLKLEGEVYVRTENPLGLMGYYLVGDGSQEPYRLKMRTASFSNVSVIPAMLPGNAASRPHLDPGLDLLRRRRRRPLVRYGLDAGWTLPSISRTPSAALERSPTTSSSPPRRRPTKAHRSPARTSMLCVPRD